MKQLAIAAAIALAAAAGWHPSTPAAAVEPPPAVHAPPPGPWARKTLARMTVPQKVGQMIGVRAFGLLRNRRAVDRRALLDQVRRLGVGSVVVFESEAESLPPLLNELQDAAPIPLLVAADMERGMSFRIRRGVVPLPYAMAIGATRSEEAAHFTGVVAAREGRALGIHWAFAPVVDVNNNPGNPVINIRSYGEDPEMVGRMMAAFVRGAREGGLMTTAKHFPGHGDTALDSHMQLVTVTADRKHLDAVELLPFRHAVAAGVDAVMTGHIAVPALDATNTPATLSAPMSTDLLRTELGFEGLIVTDAMEMSGVRAAWTGEAAIRAVQAGADFILLPPDPGIAIQALVRAVREGQITEARLDQSVLRILAAKERLNLHRKRRVDPAALADALARPEDVAQAMDVARRSITVLKNDGGVLPLHAEDPLRVLHLVMSSDLRNEFIQGWPEDELTARRIATQTVALGPEVSAETEAQVVEIASRFTHVVASAYVRVGAYRGNADMAASHARLLKALVGAGKPVILISFGSPYLLRQVPEVPVYLCAYGGPESSQRAAIGALFGEYPVVGKLPVTIPGFFDHGQGLDIPRREMTLRRARPDEAGFRPDAMAAVDQVITDAVANRAFPGGVVAVGHDGALVHVAAFGRQTYDAGATAVDLRTIYDLASLTKVIVTTTMAMILVDEGKLDLDKPVSAFIPAFKGGMKDKVTVRHLLTHSGGQAGGVTYLYKDVKGKEAYVKYIAGLDLLYEPGTKTVYTDLGEILLGDVLERVAGQDLESFAKERIFAPLGMKDTMFRPRAELLPRIAPTENDPWRGRVVHGEVHDENAFAMGGVAAHAGLFGTAEDVARFAQMLLNGGVFEQKRIVSRETVEKFTTRAGLVPDSSRALGWDTKSENSSAGDLFGPRSFGHTGFTGTSLWMDPDRKLFVVLLTNRVHPTRDNNAIREVRRAVADAVVRGLEQPWAVRLGCTFGAIVILLACGENNPLAPNATPSTPVDKKAPAAATMVRTGIDQIELDNGGLLRGRKVGLLMHAASTTTDGRRSVDALRGKDVNVVRLFSPEHGIASSAAAGETVGSSKDATTKLPVVSLYGDNKAPSAADLEGLEVFVFDLQDAGVRFYTYLATMMLTMDAAANAGLEYVVLDRPNPLGGERVEGPFSDPRDAVPESLVNMLPGPLVHGMTAGEMARLVNASRAKPAKLTVVPMRGWRRTMTWSETGRPWIPPSPNLRTPEAAIAYPGTALVEGTNASEGRGTETPFLLVGAPWLKPELLLPVVKVPGFTVEPTTFTPAASPAAPAPKHVGKPSPGLRIKVTDAPGAKPYTLGVTLLHAMRTQPGFEWLRDGEAIDRLVGTKKLRAALERGDTVEAIVAADADAIAAYRKDRLKALLY